MILFHLTRTGALALAAFMTWTMSAQANIGDDLKTLRGRYGSAKDMGSQMLFQHDGYSIAVYFDGAHAAMEVFVRDGSKPDKTDITQEDIDKLLSKEGEGHQWSAMVSGTGKPAWVRDDKVLVARLSTDSRTQDKYLTIMVNEK